MKNIKISIIGNSVALRKRPHLDYPNNCNYGEILEEALNSTEGTLLYTVTNIATGASTIMDVTKDLDHIINTFPHVYILNIGVVDASTREVPLWYYKIANSRRDTVLVKVASAIYRNLIIRMRPILVKARLKRSWTRAARFQRLYASLVQQLNKETNAKIIALSINVANDRVERQLPGTQKKHADFNRRIKRIIKDSNGIFVDTNQWVSKEQYPDGVHFSPEGHKIIAECLKNIILEEIL